MNLFGFNITRMPAAPPVRTRGLAESAADWLRGDDPARGPVLSNAYEQVVWVYRAINVLAEQVANVPFLFSAGERGRENLITSGPLPDFYAQPHPHLNRFQYWELRILWLLLRGECFRIPIYQEAPRRPASGPRRPKLRSILLPDPAHFQHILEDHQLIGWRYTGFGPRAPLASQVFLPEEVWFEKLPNPFDFWRGLAPLRVAALAAQTDFAAGAFMRGLIENNADTGVIVRTEQPLGDEQQTQIIRALKERKRRAGLADRPVFLNGVTEVIKPQLSSSDLQFLENRKFSRAEICAAFGVPEEIVTTTDYAKYDVLAGARLNFIENRVAPLCSRLEAAEDVTVKTIDPGASGWFDLDSLPILQEARRQRLAAARAGFDMGVPFNELNRVLDLGFKPLPWGNRGYIATRLREVGDDSPDTHLQGAESAASVRKSSPARTHEAVRAAGETTAQAPAQTGADGSTVFARAGEFFAGLEASPDAALCRLLERKLRRFFFAQRRRVLAGLAGQGSAGSSSPVPFDPPAENEDLEAQLEPVRRSVLGDPALASSCLADYCPSRRSWVNEVNAATRAALAQALDERGSTRETITLLAARVRALFNQASACRAVELARAEAAALSSARNQAGMHPAPGAATSIEPGDPPGSIRQPTTSTL